MNTIIKKIRAEVLRLIRETDGPGSQYGFGKMSACNRILNFLDTLQEQPVKIDIRKELASIEFMGVNDARDTETIARHFYELGCRRTAEKYDEIEYKRQRADVCDGLEEETEKFIETFGWGKTKHLAEKELISATARHFYELGKQSKPKVSEGLHSFMSERIKGLSFHDDFEIASYKMGMIDGASWQKEQMMKEAVDGEVCIPNVWVEHKEGKELVVRAEISKELGFKFGNKVRIIIVKED